MNLSQINSALLFGTFISFLVFSFGNFITRLIPASSVIPGWHTPIYASTTLIHFAFSAVQDFVFYNFPVIILLSFIFLLINKKRRA